MADRSSVSELAERAMRSTLLTLSHRRSLGRMATQIPITRPMVRRFVAGESLDEVLAALAQLRERGMRTTLDILGESVTAEADARAAAQRYLATLDAVAEAGLERNVSLKPSQMGLGISRDLARENIAAIVGRATELGAFVRIDMEDHTTTDATLDLWRTLRPIPSGKAGNHDAGKRDAGNRDAGTGDPGNGEAGPDAGASVGDPAHPERPGMPDVGVVIQAALRRSPGDVESILAADGRVRLCKGAYMEPGSVAYQDKADVDAAYERLMLRLLRAGRYPAIATHDVRLIKRAVEVAQDEGIGRDRFEFQMLYGVRRDLQEQLVDAGWRVRTYVPYGSQWYPYFMRRLAERPANVSFLLRNLWRERGRP